VEWSAIDQTWEAGRGMTADAEQNWRERRVGENEALFRDVNERINASKQGRTTWVTISPWVCECADESCTERIMLTVAEYEEVRANSTHFAVAADAKHVPSEAERVIVKHERYWVVEKVGEAAEAAEELDVR
jgi:hypothetical protein